MEEREIELGVINIAKGIFNTSRMLMNRDKYVLPTGFFLLQNGEVPIVGFPKFGDSLEEKIKANKFLHDMARELNAIAVFLVTEAWSANVDYKANAELAQRLLDEGISDYEERKEILIMTIVFRSGTCHTLSSEIIRHETGEITTTHPELMRGLQNMRLGSWEERDERNKNIKLN